MRKSRKLGIVLMVMTLVVAFALPVAQAQDEMACPEGEAEVTIAITASASEIAVTGEQANRYMELCPNITVTLLEVPQAVNDRLALYSQFWEAQSSDLDIYPFTVVWPGVVAPHMVDLTEYMSEDLIGQYFPGMIANNTIDGKLVGVPWYGDVGGLYYRTDLLEEYGLEIPQTWDELEQAAQIIQDGERAKGNADFWGYVWQGNSYLGLDTNINEWLVSETGNAFITPEREVNVTDPAFVAFVERAAGWVGTISPDGTTTYQEEDARNVFQAGNAAFMRNWPYAFGLGNAEDSPIAGKFEFVPLPMGSAGIHAGTLGGWSMGVSRYSENIEAAVSVALFMTSEEELYLSAVGELGRNPTMPSVYEREELGNVNPLFVRMGQVLPTASGRPAGLLGPRYVEGASILYQAVHSVLTGDRDAQDALEEAELDIQDILDDLAN